MQKVYSGNGTTINIDDTTGANILITGNQNEINIAGTQTEIQLTGNQNTISCVHGKIRLTLTGNGNSLESIQSAVQAKINGNANVFKSESDISPLEVFFNQGFQNDFPQSTVFKGNSSNQSVPSMSLNTGKNNYDKKQKAIFSQPRKGGTNFATSSSKMKQHVQNYKNIEKINNESDDSLEQEMPRKQEPRMSPSCSSDFKSLSMNDQHELEQQRFNQQLKRQRQHQMRMQHVQINRQHAQRQREYARQQRDIARRKREQAARIREQTRQMRQQERLMEVEPRGQPVGQVWNWMGQTLLQQFARQQRPELFPPQFRARGVHNPIHPLREIQNQHIKNLEKPTLSQQALTEAQMERLPINSHKGPLLECSICFLDMETNDEETFLGCFHSFHSFCIQSWLKKSAKCPICNENVRKGF